jgi:DNA-binding SARP family transcriptional activator/TolB-like protein
MPPVGRSVGATVEANVDSIGSFPPGELPALELRLLGSLTVSRGGVVIALPPSRKVRALLAYLALSPRPVTRSRLCDLLWDVPQDPRGELRWCLTKVRTLVDTPGRSRIETRGDTVRLDLSDCLVDAAEIARAVEDGIERLPAERLRGLAAMFSGEFLDGLELDRSPVFDAWVAANRRRLHGCHAGVLEHLVRIVPGDEVFPHLEAWLELAPFDGRAHEAMLSALARRGRLQDGDAHLAATARLFEVEGIDLAPMRAVWRSAWARADQPATREREAPATVASGGVRREEEAGPRRASVFAGSSAGEDAPGGVGDGLVHDVITRLAKLRNVFVIAQGTVFALSERRVEPQQVGRMLNVDYVVSGAWRRRGDRLTVTVELAEARTARVVWAEVYDQAMGNIFRVLDDIGDRIVASVASEIEAAESHRAVLMPPSSLDAWGAHHRGLWHMYRFSRADNELARHFFQTAVDLDPTFSRADAGLSFTHFQNAFQGWEKRDAAIDQAFAAAGESVMADDHDPAAHWAMGRALWLRGRQEQSVLELERSIDLSPNFALGHYTLAFIHSQGGEPTAAIVFTDHSRHLSPFDPLLFGMLGARAMALLRLGRFEEAAEWAVRASARPNAHVHIKAIAAYSLALAERMDEARAQLAAIRAALPYYSVETFLTAMRFSADDEALFRKIAKRI